MAPGAGGKDGIKALKCVRFAICPWGRKLTLHLAIYGEDTKYTLRRGKPLVLKSRELYCPFIILYDDPQRKSFLSLILIN